MRRSYIFNITMLKPAYIIVGYVILDKKPKFNFILHYQDVTFFESVSLYNHFVCQGKIMGIIFFFFLHLNLSLIHRYNRSHNPVLFITTSCKGGLKIKVY
jgi:hypothetical protein